VAHRTDVNHGNYTLLVFDSAGNTCYANRDYGVAGDPIFVGIYTPTAALWDPVTFENCALESAGPRVYVGAGAFPAEVKTVRAQGTDTLLAAGPRRCFNDAVDIVLHEHPSGGASKGAEHRYALRQYQRYDATLQLGVLFTPQVDRTFALRTDNTGTKIIYSQGPTGGGPDYVATLVVYSVVRQVSRIWGGDFQGRDLVHDNGVLDKIGLVLGVGLKNPARRFVVGLTFEALSGLSVLACLDLARVNELAGVNEGDAFTGAAADIPTRDVWQTRAITWGLTMDLRYVTALFSHK
jgi:hypothetical protein